MNANKRSGRFVGRIAGRAALLLLAYPLLSGCVVYPRPIPMKIPEVIGVARDASRELGQKVSEEYEESALNVVLIVKLADAIVPLHAFEAPDVVKTMMPDYKATFLERQLKELASRLQAGERSFRAGVEQVLRDQGQDVSWRVVPGATWEAIAKKIVVDGGALDVLDEEHQREIAEYLRTNTEQIDGFVQVAVSSALEGEEGVNLTIQCTYLSIAKDGNPAVLAVSSLRDQQLEVPKLWPPLHVWNWIVALVGQKPRATPT